MSLIEKIKAELEWLGVEFFSLSHDVQNQCSSSSEEDRRLGADRTRAEKAIADAQAALTAIMGGGDGVQQCDRDAAQAIYNGESIFAQAGVKARDGHELVQAFCRHRSTAAAAERARIVAWLRSEWSEETWASMRLTPDDQFGDSAKSIADAIERGEV